MKRLIYALFFIPLIVAGQQEKATDKDNASSKGDALKTDGEVVKSTINQTPNRGKESSNGNQEYVTKRNADDLIIQKIGETTYDLQTNESIGRRIQVYDDGSISAIWTLGKNPPTYINRGTGYNHFDGQTWIKDPGNIESIEDTRSGWPNIGVFGQGEGETPNEFTVTHIAQAGANAGSGGYIFSQNDGIGSTNFTSQTRDSLEGPIWYRLAQAEGFTHMIGTYSDTLVSRQGIQRPMVYYRSDDDLQSFIDSAALLPGYVDTARRNFGSADAYSIDAKDSIVTIVVAQRLRDVTMWKSTDNGQTWDQHILSKHPLTFPEVDSGKTYPDTFNANAGSVSAVIADDGKVHVSYDIFQRFFGVNNEGDTTQFFNLEENGIYYWNDEHNMVMDTTGYNVNMVDSTVFNFTYNGMTMDSIAYITDTSYTYSYNNGKDSTAQDAKMLVKYSNYDANGKQALIPTDTLHVWEPYYQVEFDANGNRDDSTWIGPEKTMMLDSNNVQYNDTLGPVVEQVKQYVNEPMRAAGAPTTPNSQYNIREGADNTGDPTHGYALSPLSSMPTMVNGGQDTLYVLYSAWVDGAIPDQTQPNYQDIFIAYSTDDGATWSEPQNFTVNAGDATESVYPSAYKYVKNEAIHLVWQRDEIPGTFVQDEQFSETTNKIMYGKIGLNRIFEGTVGEEEVQAKNIDVTTYPNPIKDQLNFTLNLDQALNVEVQLLNMVGKTQMRKDLGKVNAGEQKLNLNTRELNSGMYILKVKAGDKQGAYKVMKQ